MGLEYVVTKRVFGFDKDKNEKYVAKSVRSGKVNFAKMCRKVSELCGVHRKVVDLVVSGLVDKMAEDIDDGKSVQMGEFGIFTPTIRAKSTDDEKEVSSKSIVQRKILFYPGKIFKNTLEDMSITRRAEIETDYTDGSSKMQKQLQISLGEVTVSTPRDRNVGYSVNVRVSNKWDYL